MGRKELFEEIDECLENVLAQNNYEPLFKLTKMLNKREVIEISSQKTTLGHARKILIDFLESNRLLNVESLIEETMLDKYLEGIGISYVDVYNLIKITLSERILIMNSKPIRLFFLGMLNALISIYLDRNMVDNKVISECYNEDLKSKQEATQEIYLINLIKKEYQSFCEEKAISLVHKEGMPPEKAAYLMPRLSKLIEENIEESTIYTFIEALSYFASITFYNKCRENYTSAVDILKVSYKTYENIQINNINDLIPILIQMNFPIRLKNNIIEIDFEELNNQINIMNQSLEEKALIIK